jgi:hypothetical protein
LLARLDEVIIGDPREETTRVSALIDERSTRRVLDWVDKAISAGAKLAAGGAKGPVVRPTVLLDVPDGVECWDEEIFGPVVCLRTVPDVDAAFAEVNASRYGLHASVFSRSLKTAFRALDRLEVGGVVINEVPGFRFRHHALRRRDGFRRRTRGAALRRGGTDRDQDGGAASMKNAAMNYANLFRLDGKRAVVLGAGSGIGRESALALAAHGASVVCADRNLEAAWETAGPIEAEAYEIDLLKAGSAQRAAAELGDLDVVVLTAAMNVRKRLLDYTREEFDRVIALNLGAAFEVVRAFGAGMVKRRWLSTRLDRGRWPLRPAGLLRSCD